MNAERRGRKRWFLLPILIVILVAAGVLAGHVYAALTGARERTRRFRCRSGLGCIGYGLHHYAGEHGEAFPSTLGHLYPDYAISDGRVYLCPRARKATALEDGPHFSNENYTPAMFGDTHTDYVYVSGLKASDPAPYILAFDDEWNHDGDGVNVLFIDGTRDWIQDFKWLHDQLAKKEKELAAQGRKMKLLRPAWSSWPEPPPELSGRPSRLSHRVAVGVGMMAAIAVALAIVVRTVWRGRSGSAEPDQRKA